MKYLEQRVEELELEVKLLKTKNKLEETKKLDYLFSHSDQEFIDQQFITKFGLETSNGHFWDSSELKKNPLDTITSNLSSITNDSPYYHPEYPNVLGSWDPNPDYVDSDDLPVYYPPLNPDDILKESTGFNNNQPIRLKKTSLEAKIENKFGEIICKFPLLHHEWEMDSYGYIVENKNGRELILTSHGNPYKANVNELELKRAHYKDIIQQTERALFLLS
jgi:hypothetical protein